MTEPVRLSRYITEHFACSRREAELLIEGGWVIVNGEVVDEPQFMVTEEVIKLHPEARAEPVAPATLLLHQPAAPALRAEAAKQLITPETRSLDDHSRIRLLRKHFYRQEPVLALEPGAYGLQVFTQEWRVARKLTEDAEKLEQEIIVEVAGTIATDGLARLNQGLVFKGRALSAAKVSWQNETKLRFAIKAPQPGQIAQLCKNVGLRVLSMKRLRIGRIALSGMAAGQWRYLPTNERF
jgi:23S rRNA pseudouridine2604 synthase